MIDVPPEPPALPSKPLAEALVDCGLDAQGFTIIYDDDLRAHVVKVLSRSGATQQNLQCVWDATWSEFVEFEDGRLQLAYEQLTHDHFAPLVKQSARENLDKHGLLEGLPNRSDFASLDDFAVAIEEHCGFAANQMLRVSGDTIMFESRQPATDLLHSERFGCLISAMAASGETKLGFIGNEAFAHPQGD